MAINSWWKRNRALQAKLILPICCLFLVSCVTSPLQAQQALAIKAGKIITMAGEPIQDGVIVIRDGQIAAVGSDLEIPVEARIIDASDKTVMPGFVEAHSSDGMGQANETNPIVPYVSVLDEINPMDPYFQDARRNGVTTVAITPGNSTMIGGQAAIIKTGGTFVDAMVLKSDAGVKISLRPVSGSRMSHLAKLRETLDEAKEKLEKKQKSQETAEESEEKDSDDASERRGRRGGRRQGPRGEGNQPSTQDEEPAQEDKPDSEEKKEEETVESELDKAMFALLSGKLPAIIYCEKAMDVGTALRLIKEYQLEAKLVLGRECYKAASEIAKSELPVILDPQLVFWEEDPRTKEETKVILPKVFQDQGVAYTFQVGRSNAASLGRNYLWYQAATAVRYGMPEEQALEALTLLPARFHGVDPFVGSIEVGKDADLVILSGDPLKIDTWVETTIVNGEVVYEKETDDQLKRLLTGEEDQDE